TAEPASKTRNQVNQRCGNEDAEQRQRQQNLPAKTHQLIETKARQRAAYPDVHKKKEANFEQKTERAHQAEQNRSAPKEQVCKRHVPAAEKERRGQHRNREHVDVFRQEEQGKLHRAVFRVKTRDQFGFGFRKIERDAIRFGDRRGHVDDEPERVEEYVPTCPMPTRLKLNDLCEIECACKQDDSD